MERGRHDACPLVADAAPYLLGALADPAHYEAHLQNCATCRAAVEELRPVVAPLAASEPREHAPEAVRRRLLKQVRDEAVLRQAARHDADQATRQPVSRPRLLALATLGAIALAVGIATFASVRGDARHDRLRFAKLAPQVVGARAQLREHDGHAVLAVRGLPQPPPGETYQVWVRYGAKAPRATTALFTVNDLGKASVDIPAPVEHASEVMVTAEPRGGSIRPTGWPLMRFDLAPSS